jgi:CubicO group peptidase (beta-lactamase class C family)
VAQLEEKIHGFIVEVRRRAGLPGLSVAMVRDGVTTTSAIGTASLDKGTDLSQSGRFQLGCITKLLTCLLVLQLARAGKLDPDAAIADYLHELRDTPKGRNITVRHLASHTSGYRGINLASPEYAYFYSWEKFMAFLKDSPQVFVPGTVFNYEHTESVLLGEIIQRVTNMTALQLMRELIFEPLGLQTGSIAADAGAVADHAPDRANGGYKVLRAVPYCGFWAASLADVTLSPADLATLGDALLGRIPSHFDPDTLARAREQIVDLPPYLEGLANEQMPQSCGFGCVEYAGGLFGHNGSARGQTCGLRFDPVQGLVLVVALNAWQPHVRDLILNSLARGLQPGGPGHRVRAPGEPTRFSEVAGDYVGCVHGVDMSVTSKGGTLVCNIRNQHARTSSSITLSPDDAGRLSLGTEAQQPPVALFHEEATGSPCMMIGLNAFKRIA